MKFFETHFVVYLPFSQLPSDLDPIRWIENNIDRPGTNFYFKELNSGFSPWSGDKFNPKLHNCVEINFRYEIDKNYFLLVWGDKLR